MNLSDIERLRREADAKPKTPLIITHEWVEANKEEAIRLGLIDQDGNAIGTPYIKD